ncbi:LCP family protein [Dictyobacter arantiisoli]|uniref:LCP family protein n=1 Tax=Dictyobacter arantiisoli TaxID=2014874 RepID=UPI0011EE6A13|nr:LCP family protein [Dictyobacter arantiisoli]
MSDNYYRPDESADAPPPYPPQEQGPQGKLVLGSFHQPQPPRAPRQPAPPQGGGRPPYPPTPNARQSYPQQSPVQPPYQNPGPAYNANQRAYTPPTETPAGYPSHQPGQHQPGPGNQGPRSAKPRKKRNKRKIGCLSVLVIFIVLAVIGFTTIQRVLAFGSAISTQGPLTTTTGYMSTSDRTNLLILGYGGGSHDGANLTDSIVVVSMIPSSQHTSLVSVPRDLWVRNPPNSNAYTKINEVYQTASNNSQNRVAGGDAMATKVSLVTGMNVKNWMLIDFNGFKSFIDSIGGVDVYVPDSFNACYPKNDDANKDASWIKVQFNKGTQHMDGATAIEYARAREPVEVCGMGTSINQAELTDFGRSARQQLIIKAALGKIRNITTWPSLINAMNALQKTIYTNMSFADLGLFSQKMDLNDPKTAHIGLSTSNVMDISTASDGESIVIPKGENWPLISEYIQSKLYN